MEVSQNRTPKTFSCENDNNMKLCLRLITNQDVGAEVELTP